MRIAIIGAGICGLYLAWKLAERGHEITVFEKKNKIGKGVCSGLISERILDFIPQSKKLVQNRIDFCLIYFPKKTLKIIFSNPEGKPSVSYGAGKFLVMSHFELDNLVAILAQEAGAKVFLNRQINSLPEGFDRIIGCDGGLSIIRRYLNLPNPDFRLGIQGFIKENNYSNYVETWPNKTGFIWKIPRGNETEYGIIADPKKAPQILEDFFKKNNLKTEEMKSALVPQGLIMSNHPSITICGDAAGLTKPWSGGGIIWGLTAANLLLKNFPNFLKYKKEVKRFFLPKIIFSKTIEKAIYVFGFNFPWVLPKNYKIESDFLI